MRAGTTVSGRPGAPRNPKVGSKVNDVRRLQVICMPETSMPHFDILESHPRFRLREALQKPPETSLSPSFPKLCELKEVARTTVIREEVMAL